MWLWSLIREGKDVRSVNRQTGVWSFVCFYYSPLFDPASFNLTHRFAWNVYVASGVRGLHPVRSCAHSTSWLGALPVWAMLQSLKRLNGLLCFLFPCHCPSGFLPPSISVRCPSSTSFFFSRIFRNVSSFPIMTAIVVTPAFYSFHSSPASWRGLLIFFISF